MARISSAYFALALCLAALVATGPASAGPPRGQSDLTVPPAVDNPHADDFAIRPPAADSTSETAPADGWAPPRAPSRPGDLIGFDGALDEAAKHNQAALAHLQAIDFSLAEIELAHLRESFGLLLQRYGAARRAAYADDDAYAAIVVDVPMRIVTAQMMLGFGRPDIAVRSLIAVCRSLLALQLAPGGDAAACEPAPR